MSKFLDAVGTSVTSFQIGAKQAGAKVLRFINGNNVGSLSWQPTAARTLTLPDKTDTIAGLADIGFPVFNVSVTTRNINLGDAFKTLYCTNSAPLTITVPTHASVSLTVGTVIEVIQASTNSVTISASSGVTLSRLNSSDNSHQLTGQWCVVQLKKVATDAWVFFFKSTQGSSSPSYSFLLDAVPNPLLACSTLKLSSTASNGATIRRSSDNTTTDIGFTSGVLSSSAITAFGGAGDTFLTTFLDQSGNGKHLITTGNSYQMSISTGATVNTWNGIPCAVSVAGSRLDTTNITFNNTGFTFIGVYKQLVAGNQEIPFVTGQDNHLLIGQNIYGTGSRFVLATSVDWDESGNYQSHTNGYICTCFISNGFNSAIMATVKRTQISSVNTWTDIYSSLSFANFFGANYNLGSISVVAYLIYPRLITSLELLTIEGFFANKLNIQGSLGVIHPYYSAPPF